jgi:hypothetical protein
VNCGHNRRPFRGAGCHSKCPEVSDSWISERPGI